MLTVHKNLHNCYQNFIIFSRFDYKSMHLQCLHCIIIVQGNYTHFALVPVFEMESANVCLKFILER